MSTATKKAISKKVNEIKQQYMCCVALIDGCVQKGLLK